MPRPIQGVWIWPLDGPRSRTGIPVQSPRLVPLTAPQIAQLKVDLEKRVFSLPSTAAVVDKGTALEGFSDDFRGVKRPQGAAWDIGAYEYAAPAAK